MTKKFICFLAVIVLAICLLSGGCFSTENNTIKAWKELISLSPQKDKAQKSDSETGLLIDNLLKKQNNDSQEEKSGKNIEVELYFLDPGGKKLIKEKRNITKVEGIARKTIEELIKGPAKDENLPVFPEGTRLLDINVKPDGLCIVDLSSQARNISNQQQEKYMIYAITNTLGQFPTINEVEFMINGDRVDAIGQYVDLSIPIEPDYSV